MPIYCSCIICKSNVATSQLSIHYGSKKCLNGGKQIAKPSLSCAYCNKIFPTSVGRGLHEVQCKENSNRRILNLGRVAWNKGNRSKPDTRNPQFVGQIGGYRPNAGRSKKFKVRDSFGKETTLQSTFELRCAEILDKLKINWIRPKALKYNGKNYFADFYLVDYDVYLDPKNNYKAKLDKEKINLVIAENNVKLYVLVEEHITEEYITGII